MSRWILTGKVADGLCAGTSSDCCAPGAHREVIVGRYTYFECPVVWTKRVLVAGQRLLSRLATGDVRFDFEASFGKRTYGSATTDLRFDESLGVEKFISG